MKRLFVLLCLISGIGAAAADTAGSIRVATYNIRLKIASDSAGGNGWESRAAPVNALIRFHAFDVVGLQEVLHPQLVDLLADGVYKHVGVGRDDAKEAGEHSPILYRPDKFALLDSGTFWLSETPETVFYGWDATKYHRICTWAKLQDLHSGKIFQVWNSHFDHEAVVARRNSAKLILERLKPLLAAGVPVIVLGDFNATPDTEPYQILAAGLHDTRGLSKTPVYGPEGTFNAFNYTGSWTARIDHIFVSDGFTVLRHGTLTDSYEHHFPSDHFPVVTDLVLP